MWKTVKLGEICDVLDSLRKPITKKNRVEGDYPYYGTTGIVDWVEDNAQDIFYTTTIGVNAKKFYFKSPLDFDNMQKLHQNMPVPNLKLIK